MFTLSAIKQSFLKFGLLHLVFWISYSSFVYHGFVQNSGGNIQFVIKSTSIIVCTNMLGVYFMVYKIVPQYYTNKKYIQLFFILIAVIFCSSLLSILLRVGFVWNHYHGFYFYIINFFTTLIDSILPYFSFLSVVIFNYAIQQQKALHLKEKEFLVTEIQLLKSQMNPHLIFNALNSIYILMDEDKKKAQNVLMNFSDVLRYQLYESSEDNIELTSEIEFIKKYIELEKIRKSDGLQIQTNFEIHHPLKIASLILQPIIENAFKYVSQQKGNQWININCKTTEKTFECLVVNSVDGSKQDSSHQGIGLANLKRRLAIIYPNLHQLHIQEKPNQYSISLIISIS
jgi:two-component system, LytTR family, sensor kinase